MERTERLLDLVALLLDASEPVPFAQLREIFPADYGTGSREAAERKLERDKAELVQLGVPLEFVPPDEDRELGGYRIDRKAYFLPDLKLSPEEGAALYAAGSAALASHDFPFAQDLAHALRKIALEGGARDDAPGPSAARRLLIVRPGDPARAGKLRVLGDAVARRKRVHATYRAAPAMGPGPQASSAGERTEREIDPYGLAFRGGSWRLVGYCHLRKDMRVFVVDRIESLRANESKPNQPDFEIPAGFDAGATAGARPWQWVGTPARTVRLRFAAGSELLAERAFDAPAQRDAKGALLDLPVTYLDGLIPEVLSFGDRVWIESPAEAREKALAALRQLDARLQKPATAPLPTGAASAAPSGQAPSSAGAADGGERPEASPLPPAESGKGGRRGTARSSKAARAGRPTDDSDKRERLRRLLLIVPAARRKPGIRVEELARELGLDASELLADIDLLALVGRPPFSPDDMIDISVDERSRVFVTLDGSFSRPPQLTALEALALAAAAEAVAAADPAVTSALQKLTAALPAQARALYAGLAQRVAMATPVPRGTSALIAQLRAAAQRWREVVLDYDKEGRGAHEERTLQPWAVIDHGGRWYVYGHDTARGAQRTFRVDRLRAVRETGATFPDPGPLDPALFERASFFFPTGAERPVALRFSPGAAAWALSRYGARAVALPGGGAEATIDSAGTAYAVSLALSLAGEAEVIDPPEARAALRDAVARALSRYHG
ncbi:MAG TPA: WYL domain-containing protein [Myxococcales bacterium]|jgi:predicted DNA-binding transcriptional regulator YafY|nr:WYL domain-containing protein [Myxococcales bacterium]